MRDASSFGDFLFLLFILNTKVELSFGLLLTAVDDPSIGLVASSNLRLSSRMRQASRSHG